MKDTLRAENLTGRKIGHVEVLGPSGKRRGGWNCLCSCGVVFEAIRHNIEAAGEKYRCPECRPRGGRGVPTCGVCGESGHDRTTCPKAPAKKKKPCECSGLPHRRPEGRACGCGGFYVPEKPCSVEYAHSMTAPAPREVA